MADAVRDQQTEGASRAPSGGPDGARPPGSRRAEIGMPIALLGLFVALLPPIIVSLALKVAEVAPESTAGTLSLVLGLGALVALVVNPLAGRLSDRTRGRFGSRSMRTLHNTNDASGWNLRCAMNGTVLVDCKGNSKPVAAAGVDTDDILEEERYRRSAVDMFALGLRMLLECLHRRKVIQADELQPSRFCDAEGFGCRFPAMADADPKGLVRQDFKRDRGVSEHFGVAEDRGSLKTGIIAGSATEELVFTGSGEGQLVNEHVRVTSKSVR